MSKQKWDPINAGIIVQYPPDYDGELHIQVDEKAGLGPKVIAYRFTVDHAPKGNAWETLVAMARAIIAQDERLK